MKKVTEFKYLGIVLCKNGSMKGKAKERGVKGRQVIGALERAMKGIIVNMGLKKGISSTVPSTVIHLREMWLWIIAQQTQLRTT